MVLEFREPYLPDRNRNLRSLSNLNQTIGGIGSDWQQYGQQQKQNRLQQAYLGIAQAQERDRAAKLRGEEYGTLPLMGDQSMAAPAQDMTPQGTQSWSPSPLDIGRQPWAQSPSYQDPSPLVAPPRSQPPMSMMPPQGQSPFASYLQEASAGTPDTGWPSQSASQAPQIAPQGPQPGQPFHAPGTDLSAHFNAWKQQGGGPYNHPEMSGMMSTPTQQPLGQPNPMDAWNQYARIPGASNRAEYRLFQKEQGTQGLQSSEMAKNQAMADFYSGKTGHLGDPKPASLKVGEQTNQFNQREWDKIVKDTDPTQATSRSLLGRAGVATFQANRALQTLSHPVVTNQEASNAMADIAAIYQNGSPTEFGMSHQAYTTLYGRMQGILQSITGKPQDAMTNDIKQRLIGVLSDMKKTNSGVIKQKLDLTERAKSRIIKNYPEEWKQIRQTLEGDQSEYSGLGDQTGQGGQQFSHTATGANGQKIGWNGQAWVPAQ